MATLASMPDFIHILQHERFTKGQEYCLSHVSLSSDGNMAVSSRYHGSKFETCVDLYCGTETSSSWDKFRLFYSNEFDRFLTSTNRRVSFLENDSAKIVSCIGNKIEIINTANEGKVLRSRMVNRRISCLGVRDGEVFIGFFGSRTLIVFTNDLEETNKIILQGSEDGDCPLDLQVNKDTVVVCTKKNAFSIREHDGSTLTDYKNTTEKEVDPASITVSTEVGLVAVLWGSDHIIVYPLNKENPLLIVDLGSTYISVIRISARDRMMITGRPTSCGITMYYLEDIFTYDHMKESILSELTREDCLELSSFFNVNKDSLESILKSDTPKKSLLLVLEECGVLQPSDVDAFADALGCFNLPSCFNAVDIYRKTRRDYKTKSSDNGLIGELKTTEVTEDDGPDIDTEEQIKACTEADATKEIEGMETNMQNTLLKELELTKRALRETRIDRDQIIIELEEALSQTKKDMTKLQKTETDANEETEGMETSTQEILLGELEFTKRALREIRTDRDQTLIELHKNQLDLAKESRALEEVLSQTKKDMTKLQKRAAENYYIPDRLVDAQYEEVSLQAAEFGRLIIAIADKLTLDHSLKLSLLFHLPISATDSLCRVSLFQTPGMKFLDEIRNRNIINMYNVTNLQKALEVLELDEVNLKLVNPYQENVNNDQHELHKAEEIFKLEAVNTFAVTRAEATENIKDDNSVTSQSDIGEKLKETQENHPTMTVKKTSSSLKDRSRNVSYIEHSIDREGGVIHLAGATLTIPSEAFLESHVIGLSVTNKPLFPLPNEVDKSRMTPLIKLEPLGLMCQKRLQLKIPHSALIPEPKRHDVTIYSGQTSKNTKQMLENITWTEERFLPRQLQEKSVMVDIQRLSYFSASLITQPTGPSMHIVRVVPFVDGVRNSEDDITLTVCFCIDNDSEYNLLLSDYRNKLCLEQYSTLHVLRHLERDEDGDILNVAVSSVSNAYVPDTDQTVKRIAVSHLCTASRVSHQLILGKNRDIKSDIVDVKLTFFQSEDKVTDIFLKTRVKDLMISQESEERLCVPPDLKPYEDLKATISSVLETLHCRQLATYFNLTPAEVERVETNSTPGRILMKILDEREKIMPHKMIDLFQGLKACHLDKIARQVSEYIDQEAQKHESEPVAEIPNDDSYLPQPTIKPQELVGSTQSDRYLFLLKTLIEEGYAKQDVMKALDISKNRLDLARRVLKCLKEPCEAPEKPDLFLYKEQYIDENGGDVTLLEANTHMLIPVGAFSGGRIVSITMMMDKHVNIPLEGRTTRLTPVIKCGQEGLSLDKPVTLRIPHCAAETEGIIAADMYLGFSNEGNEIQWRKRQQHEPRPFLKKDHFEVHLQQLCAVSLCIAVDYKKALVKRLRVLPLVSQVLDQSDELTITLMFYNDDETEHMYLLHEQIGVEGKIQLHDYKSFTVKGSDKDKQVNIISGHDNIIPYPNENIKKIPTAALFQTTRYSVAFRFHNKEKIKDISFKIRLCSKQFLRTVDDLQFDVNLTLTELSQQPHESTRGLFQTSELHPAMERSFQELVSELSKQLGVDSCLDIARSFGLFANLKDKIRGNCEPGTVLIEELIHQQLISASHVSALHVALTRNGNEHQASVVKEYRRRNATFPTTVFY